MPHPAIVIALLLAMTGGSAALASDIYKWTDEQGNVQYGDRPEGQNSVRVDLESRRTDPSRVQAIAQARAASRFERNEAKAAAAAEQPTAEELREEAVERAKKCSDFQQKLESYTNSRRIYRETPDGEREYLNEEKMTEARELAAQRVAEFCS